jgi:hypothetical protein
LLLFISKLPIGKNFFIKAISAKQSWFYKNGSGINAVNGQVAKYHRQLSHFLMEDCIANSYALRRGFTGIHETFLIHQNFARRTPWYSEHKHGSHLTFGRVTADSWLYLFAVKRSALLYYYLFFGGFWYF